MEDRSSKTSIIVALVAIVLIVGGIYLLNQSISSQKNTTVDKKENIIAVSPQTDPEPTNFAECQSRSGFIVQGPPEECTYNGKTFVKDVVTDTPQNEADFKAPVDADNDIANIDDTNANQTNNSQTVDANNNPNHNDVTTIVKLDTDEFTAKLVSIDGDQSNYKIIDSGFVNSKWVKTGSNMNLVGITKSSFGINLEIGKTYKFKANIAESATGFQINKIDSIAQLD